MRVKMDEVGELASVIDATGEPTGKTACDSPCCADDSGFDFGGIISTPFDDISFFSEPEQHCLWHKISDNILSAAFFLAAVCVFFTLSISSVFGQNKTILKTTLQPTANISFGDPKFLIPVQIYEITDSVKNLTKLPKKIKNVNLAELGVFHFNFSINNNIEPVYFMIHYKDSVTVNLYKASKKPFDFRNSKPMKINAERSTYTFHQKNSYLYQTTFALPKSYSPPLLRPKTTWKPRENSVILYKHNNAFVGSLEYQGVLYYFGLLDNGLNHQLGNDIDYFFLIDSDWQTLSQLPISSIKFTHDVKYVSLNEDFFTVSRKKRHREIKFKKIKTPKDFNIYKTLSIQKMIYPEIIFTNLEGQKILIEEILNTMPLNSYLLIDFYGLWCKQCIKDIPALKELNQRDSINILSLNEGDSIAKINDFIRKNDISWFQGFASDSLYEFLGKPGFPYYILLNKNGEIMLKSTNLTKIESFLKHGSHY